MATWQLELQPAPQGARALDLWLQHAAGRILFEDVRGYALGCIAPGLATEARAAAEKAVDDALYGLMMVIDGAAGALGNEEKTVELAVAVRLVDQASGAVTAEVDLREGDGMCMGFHGWVDGDYGRDPVAKPKPRRLALTNPSIALLSQGFFAWADQALCGVLPASTVAFHFNLYEGGDSVHIQLMGTASFDAGEVPERDYWPGAETFSTGEEIFELPFSVAGAHWQEWRETSIELVQSYIEAGEKSSILRSSQGIGIGFVDGDMHVLWRPDCA